MNEEDKKLQDLYAIYGTSVGAAQHKSSVSTKGLSMTLYLMSLHLMHELHQQQLKNHKEKYQMHYHENLN